MIFNLYREQKIYSKLEDVFAFFEKVENLEKITPPWLQFKIISNRPYIVKENSEFEYTIKILGIRVKWKSIISEYNPPYKFVDTQIKGPYKKWVHSHIFKEFPNFILMIDSVEYELYGGFLSPIINRFFVRKKLNDIFDYRKLKIQETFRDNHV